jgi:ribosome maturation factor RimP
MTKVETEVFQCLEPIINNLNYELYDVIYEKEGKDNVLRIFIDKSDGLIDINDCELVNNNINDILDEKNFIKGQYLLEVSSPGLERIIRLDKHFKRYLNTEININLYKAIIEGNNSKEIHGILVNYDDESITIKLNDKETKINKKDISIIKTYFDWNNNKIGG